MSMTDERAEAYAWKYLAEMRPETVSPTDENLERCFRHCGIVPKVEDYDVIRSHITIERSRDAIARYEEEFDYSRDTARTDADERWNRMMEETS